MSDKQNSNLPLVSVPVVTYNSVKTVLETLESIKAQTYPNIELIISDDCSTDNTVELCREWVAQNKERFARTEIVTAQNTGVAGNCNRANAACTGEWVKSIAGDDLLMPNCIQDCMDYVTEHSDTIYLFGRCKTFGADEKKCKQIDRVFDYSFFNKTPEVQLHRLIFEGNCVPGTAIFYHRERAANVGVKDDERIPLLEDWPRWINLIRAGVKLHFVDKVLVKYRVGGISTIYRPNPNIYRSNRMFTFLYQFPEWYKIDPEKATKRVVEEEMQIYQLLMNADKQLSQIQQSKAYRLGKFLLHPFAWLRIKR
jgi:alpha-1,3-rhamnosyltransferase